MIVARACHFRSCPGARQWAVAEADGDVEVRGRDRCVEVPVAVEVAEHHRARVVAGGEVRRSREAAVAVSEQHGDDAGVARDDEVEVAVAGQVSNRDRGRSGRGRMADGGVKREPGRALILTALLPLVKRRGN